MKEEIRRLQKEGSYKFDGLTREESKTAAVKLAKAAAKEDRKYGVDCTYGIARDVFGYYQTVIID